jgi:hypothetical protein
VFIDNWVVFGIVRGHVPLRTPQRRERCRKSGQRGFDTPWPNPKPSVIHVVVEKAEGKVDFRTLHDDMLNDCNAVHPALTAYLKTPGRSQAAEFIVLGDGEECI